MNLSHRIAAIGFATLLFAGTSAVSFAQTDDTPTGGTQTAVCPTLSQTLVRGMRDSLTRPSGQVSELQTFITDYYNLNENLVVGGYFGRLTQQYVVQFQQENNLPSYGIVGTLTRAKIAQLCGGTIGTINTTLSATPNTGAAPLAVTFTSNQGGGINFGDGNTGSLAFNGAAYQTTYTYKIAGTYTAVVTSIGSCSSGTCAHTASATVTVTGSNNVQATLTASPTTGSAPLAVTFTSNQGGGINFGDNSSGTLIATACTNSYPTSSCTYTATHTYQTAGTFTALSGAASACSAGVLCALAYSGASAVVTVNGGGTDQASLTASPLSGTAPLTVGFTAVTPYGSNTSNIIDFGDGSSGTFNSAPICNGCLAQATASHTYASAGTYIASTGYSSSCSGNGSIYCPIAMKRVSATVTVTGPVVNTNATLSASPTSGSAPLTIGFSASNLQSTGTYYLSYGDNTDSVTICRQDTGGVASCGSAWNGSHTYQNAGTFTATLSRSPACAPNVICTAVIQLVSTLSVTVNSGTTNQPTLSASPASGTAPLAVTFGASGLPSGGSYSVNFGDGTAAQLVVGGCTNSYPNPSCFYQAQHTYQNAGTYTAKIYNNLADCSTNSCSLATTAVTVSGSNTNNGTLTATPSIGQASLNVTFTSSQGGSINFGDNTTGNMTATSCTNSFLNSSCTYQATHTYQSSGTYTASIGSGSQTASTVVTVKISGL
jgi:PKD repeat protein